MRLCTIVVGTDFAETSAPAVEQAIALALHHQAKLVLVHGSGLTESALAVHDEALRTASAWQSYVAERMRVAQDKLDEVASSCRDAGVDVAPRLSHGFADAVLVTTAHDVHADLIVMGTHGRQGSERWLLGSVAESVLRMAHRNVLIARAGTPPRGRFERVLCATDFSKTADRGLDTAIALAAPGAVIDVVHCWEPPLFYGLPPPSALADRLRQRAVERGNQLCAQHASGARRVGFHLLEKPPVEGILQWMGEAGCEQLVLGSHGRRGVRRLLLGSVAEQITRQAPLSVLVARGE